MTLTVTTDRELIQTTLINWLSASTGITTSKIIWLNQAIKRPAKPYIGILPVTRGRKVGTDDVIQTFDVPSQKIQRVTHGPRVMTLQIEIYTDPATDSATLEAHQLLENALLHLDTEDVRGNFRAAKIGLMGHSVINRLDEILGERWERRAGADVMISYSGETFDDGATFGNWIEMVDFSIYDPRERFTDSGLISSCGEVWNCSNGAVPIADNTIKFDGTLATASIIELLALEDDEQFTDYLFEFEIVNYVSGFVFGVCGGQATGTKNANGLYSQKLFKQLPDDHAIGFIGIALFVGDIINISCKKIGK